MQLTPSSKFHKALIAAAFVLVPLCAHANSTVCNKAPFGASWAHYLQFSLDGAVVSKGNLKMAFMIAAIGKDELQDACRAKLMHLDVQQFYRMGLTPYDISTRGVTQLAAYAQAWASEKASTSAHNNLSLLDYVVKT